MDYRSVRAAFAMAAASAGGHAGPAGKAAAALAVTGAVAYAAPGATAIGPLRRSCFPGLSGRGAPGHVALTFDDGPDPRSTPRFLELLASRRTHATFFLLGSMVARAPGLAAELTAAGHEVAVHGWDHRLVLLRGPGSVRDDITRARAAVAEATGTVPAFYRPPHGVLTAAAIGAARRLGLAPRLWTCWGREWAAGATAQTVLATIRRDLSGGATVLLHDSDRTAPPRAARLALAALPALLDECAQRGWRVGTAAAHASGPVGVSQHPRNRAVSHHL